MIKRLEKFYATFGDKGVMFCLYALTLVINSLFTISAELPMDLTEEISSAGVAAFYSGKEWSALLQDIGMNGYIQQFLYAPLFRLFRTPYAVYKAMLVVNAIIISFVPLIAYHLASKIGIVKVRRKLLCAVCSGIYVSYIASTKYVSTSAAACLLMWVLVWCVFAAWDKKNRYTRFAISLLTGFLCALSYAADQRMLVVVPALVLTAVIAKLGFKERIFNLPVLGISLVVSFVTEHFARRLVASGASNGIITTSIKLFSDNVGGGIFGRIFANSYAYMTGSIGMAAISAAIIGAMVVVWIIENIKNKPKVLDDGTKVYETIKHKYSVRPAVFGIYQFLTALFSIVGFSVFTFCGETANFSEICKGMDLITSLAVFFAIGFIVLYGSDLPKLFISVGIYSLICTGFALTYYSSGQFAKPGIIAPMLPFRICEGLADGLTGISFVIMSSCVYSFFALMIVITTCSGKRLMRLVAVLMYEILIYNTIYVGFYYLPETARIAKEKNASYVSVSELLYNNAQSPPIIVAYDDKKTRELAGMLQFLNFNTKVSIMKPGDKVPESCLLVAESGITAPFDGGSYDVVGKAGGYTVYAYGETARDFIRYSSISNGGTSSAQ